MTWWLSQPSRALAEKVAVADLEEVSGWLSALNWGLGEDLQLGVDFDITCEGETFGLKMLYPSTFPDTPPFVLTRDRSRVSWHQYGPQGELCLEYRPDNWDSTLTGAAMIQSSYNLIAGERPAEGISAEVESAHRTSIGQQLRTTHLRLILSAATMRALNELTEGAQVPFFLCERIHSKTFVAHIASLGDEKAPVWSSDLPAVKCTWSERGIAVRVPPGAIDVSSSIGALGDALVGLGFDDLRRSLIEQKEPGFLLFGQDDNWTLLWFHGDVGARLKSVYRNIHLSESTKRLPGSFKNLKGRLVGVIGCGSIGSKIAATLARSGVDRFLLVDDDIFVPDNLVRNELDVRGIGIHKVDALSERLKEIGPGIDVVPRRVAFGGQESSGTIASVMEALSKCDLIVEATADARAFDLSAAVSTRYSVSMIWCEVYAGGIGGIVARARPSLDPPAQAARAQITAWCNDHGMPWLGQGSEGDYSARFADAPPLIADDADVSVIAAHASRMTLDALTRGSESIFPDSAYAIGLAPEWIFSAPFDTWPIALRMEGEWGESREEVDEDQLSALIRELFPPKERNG